MKNFTQSVPYLGNPQDIRSAGKKRVQGRKPMPPPRSDYKFGYDGTEDCPGHWSDLICLEAQKAASHKTLALIYKRDVNTKKEAHHWALWVAADRKLKMLVFQVKRMKPGMVRELANLIGGAGRMARAKTWALRFKALKSGKMNKAWFVMYKEAERLEGSKEQFFTAWYGMER